MCLLDYKTTGEDVRRKKRRTTEDYEGTEACGFMDVVPSWLLVKFNTLW